MGNSNIPTKNLVTSEPTQMALERVLQQLNYQGQFDTSISEGNNPYGFHEQILTTPTVSIKEQLKSNVSEDTGHDLMVS